MPPQGVDPGVAGLIQEGVVAFDVPRVGEAVNDLIAAVRRQAAALRRKNWQRVKPAELARLVAYTVKAMDEATRLGAFVQGQPDSRPGRGGSAEWLSLLTDEEVRELMRRASQARR